ncbi:MAG TPA: polymer-forming cytoskeletal protein [Candidatus Binatia bacterium]|nr:polymer-forming cytoskeletal protein [Candidatus Binatia bacterium]
MSQTGGESGAPGAPSAGEGLAFKHEIAADTAITGKIHFPGDARIDGRLKGEVRADGLLVVGESAVLHANVRADRLVLHGTIQGNVFRTRIAELLPGSRVLGGVESERLVVHPGALVDGECRIGQPHERAAATPKVVLLERPIQARGR